MEPAAEDLPFYLSNPWLVASIGTVVVASVVLFGLSKESQRRRLKRFLGEIKAHESMLLLIVVMFSRFRLIVC